MTPIIRLLFDECIGKPIMQRLAGFLEVTDDQLEFHHLLDYQKQGTFDEDWVPMCANQKFIIVTTDRGKQKSGGMKLPEVCREHGITHIMLSAKVHSLNSIEKTIAILTVWEEIKRAVAAKPGSGFVVKKTNSGTFALEQKY